MFKLEEMKDSTIMTNQREAPIQSIHALPIHFSRHLDSDTQSLPKIGQELPMSELLSKLVREGAISYELFKKSIEVANRLQEILTNYLTSYLPEMYLNVANIDGEWMPCIEVSVDVKDTDELIEIWGETLKSLERVVGKNVLKKIHIEFNEKEE
ncbi:hypothetical protein [Thermococcus sp.]|uniref:hypothetical protein n=1 Tax=Thermococcus sp. TaxID=35749 RepID=UPI0019A95FE5|nr:hypothetical protein [Thermococcus sp.]MBC7094870.1 hypothetical protein [Thermococcus sp.]